ncbi:N-acyl amino acid synthase FeeM domain-containing protein [Roseibium sp. SCP14]|uniref:N-acyl amino acid synthase FeeM domain-containing protein n=1 Tax=Roseibium sp. SCP14 TaxID=3141375 RepID=UPI00333C5148
MSSLETHPEHERRKENRRHAIHRRRLKLRLAPPDGVIFKLAETTGELIQACKILYEAYTAAGYMRSDGSGIRLTPYHTLPSCYTLIAKEGKNVVATTTIVVKSLEALPIEKIFSLDDYLAWDRRVCEISSLTVHPKYRSRHGELIFSLIKYLFKFVRETLRIHDCVITCNPKHIEFYEAVLLFNRISDEVINSYDFVDGAPAIGAHLDLITVTDRYALVYDGAPREKDLYKYLFELEFDNFQMPTQVPATYQGNRWSPRQLTSLLGRHANGASSFSPAERAFLRRHYATPEYDVAFEICGSRSQTQLFDLNIATNMYLSTESYVPVLLRRVDGNRISLSARNPYALMGGGKLAVPTVDGGTTWIELRPDFLHGGHEISMLELVSRPRLVDLLQAGLVSGVKDPRLQRPRRFTNASLSRTA